MERDCEALKPASMHEWSDTKDRERKMFINISPGRFQHIFFCIRDSAAIYMIIRRGKTPSRVSGVQTTTVTQKERPRMN